MQESRLDRERSVAVGGSVESDDKADCNVRYLWETGQRVALVLLWLGSPFGVTECSGTAGCCIGSLALLVPDAPPFFLNENFDFGAASALPSYTRFSKLASC